MDNLIGGGVISVKNANLLFLATSEVEKMGYHACESESESTHHRRRLKKILSVPKSPEYTDPQVRHVFQEQE